MSTAESDMFSLAKVLPLSQAWLRRCMGPEALTPQRKIGWLYA